MPLYRYRAGIPWRDLPEHFGDFRVIHTRHLRWSRKGIWKKGLVQQLFGPLNIVLELKKKSRSRSINLDQAIGRSSGGLSTKIHAVCDALGNIPSLFIQRQDKILAGQDSDLQGMDALMDALIDEITKAKAALADKAYDADDRVHKKLRDKDCTTIIPSKKHRITPIDYEKEL